MRCVFVASCLTFAAFCLATPALAEDKIDITGKYEGEGTNPQGQNYKTAVEVKKNGDTYTLNWTVGENETYEGFGILQGDVLAVSFTAGNGHGVVLYKVSKNKLDGKWSLGDGKIYEEKLAKK
jgi:hypothetical protein